MAGDAETNEFWRRVLASALFSAFVDENFVFWLGDVGQPEGRCVCNLCNVCYACNACNACNVDQPEGRCVCNLCNVCYVGQPDGRCV